MSFDEKADLSAWRSALEALPPSTTNSEETFSSVLFLAIYSRDWKKARELVRSSSKEELPFVGGPMVPRLCMEIPIAKYQGEHPEMNAEFGLARNQLLHKVEENPEDPARLSTLGQIDAYLGRKQDAIKEARRAVEMLPVTKDAFSGPPLLNNLAIVYALTDEMDLAFQALEVSIKIPGGVTYGELKLDPDWDSLRNDMRFEKLLTQLAPHE
jgi:tetratricopeptide (TPR) repeat protein